MSRRETTFEDDDCTIWQVFDDQGAESWEVKVGALKRQIFPDELSAIAFMRDCAPEAAHDRPPEGWAFKRRADHS